MSLLSQLPYALEILLDLLLLALLVRGPFRKYIVFSLYILVQIVSHSAVAYAYNHFGFKSPIYRNLYWIDEVTVDLFLFLVVIAFTYSALEGSPMRPKAATGC